MSTRSSRPKSNAFLISQSDEYAFSFRLSRYERGIIIGQWRIEDFLNFGGSSEVYLVSSQTKRRRVAALKILDSDSIEVRTGFENEIDFLCKQGIAPYMPRYYARGNFDGNPYYVMERLYPLKSRYNFIILFLIFIRITWALERLARLNLIHGDIKPCNFMMSPRGVLLIDYGCTDSADNIARRTKVIATPRYAASQTKRHGIINSATDVYALGVSLCELAGPVGKLVFRSLILRATNENPQERPKDMADFRRQLTLCMTRLLGQIVLGVLLLCAILVVSHDYNASDKNLMFERQNAIERIFQTRK